jgi:hypothetical protein
MQRIVSVAVIVAVAVNSDRRREVLGMEYRTFRGRDLAHRERWGEERIRRIFTVEACLYAKIATAEVGHMDAWLIRANVSWDSPLNGSRRCAKREQSEAETEEKKGRQSGKYKKVCTTDAGATMAMNARN